MESTIVTTKTVTTVHHTSETTVLSTDTREDKMKKVLESAKIAFWAVVAGNYPGLPGDIDPLSSVRFDHECERVLVDWLEGK